MRNPDDKEYIEELKVEIARLLEENEKLTIKKYDEESEHTCYEIDENGERYGTGEDCNACLQVHRMERYGSDIHDVNCICNDCTYGPDGYPRADY